MNHFVNLVLWQIAFILMAITGKCALDEWVDGYYFSGALLINAVVLVCVSFFSFMASNMLFSMSCATASLAFTISVLIMEPKLGEAVVLPTVFGGFALILFFWTEYNANENYRLKHRWILTSAMIQAISICTTLSMDIGDTWAVINAGSIILLYLAGFVGDKYAIRHEPTQASPASPA